MKVAIHHNDRFSMDTDSVAIEKSDRCGISRLARIVRLNPGVSPARPEDETC